MTANIVNIVNIVKIVSIVHIVKFVNIVNIVKIVNIVHLFFSGWLSTQVVAPKPLPPEIHLSEDKSDSICFLIVMKLQSLFAGLGLWIWLHDPIQWWKDLKLNYQENPSRIDDKRTV